MPDRNRPHVFETVANMLGDMSLWENSADPLVIDCRTLGVREGHPNIGKSNKGEIDECHHIYNLTQPRIAEEVGHV